MNTVMPRAKVLRQALGKTNIEEQRPVMLTVDEACESLRISKWTLYRLIHEKRIKTGKLGTRRLIPAASIADLVAEILEAEG